MSYLKEVIANRRSIRKYQSQSIEKEKIIEVLNAGNLAPSNGNSQPWKFYVLGGEFRDLVCKTFYEFAKDYIPKAPYIPAEKKAGMLEYAKDFGGAPLHIAVSYEICGDKIKDDEALMAASAAVQNILLAAYDLGLGTVWIGGEVLTNKQVLAKLEVPQNHALVAIIPIGYPAENPITPPRKDPDLNEVKWLA